MDPDDKDFAREALNGFFRRRGAAGTFYCTACLVERLSQRRAGASAVHAPDPSQRIRPEHTTSAEGISTLA